MAVFHLFQDGGQFATQPLVEAKAEHLGELVGREAEQSQVAGTLEEFMDGEVPAKDEVATVFHLLQGVVAAEIDGGRSFWENLGPTTQVQ